MTRDEALAIVRDASKQHYPDSLVDAFVKLGVLKLDEPLLLTAENKFASVIASFLPGREVDQLWDEMERAGLQIVEKPHA